MGGYDGQRWYGSGVLDGTQPLGWPGAWGLGRDTLARADGLAQTSGITLVLLALYRHLDVCICWFWDVLGFSNVFHGVIASPGHPKLKKGSFRGSTSHIIWLNGICVDLFIAPSRKNRKTSQPGG